MEESEEIPEFGCCAMEESPYETIVDIDETPFQPGYIWLFSNKLIRFQVLLTGFANKVIDWYGFVNWYRFPNPLSNKSLFEVKTIIEFELLVILYTSFKLMIRPGKSDIRGSCTVWVLFEVLKSTIAIFDPIVCIVIQP